MYCLHCKLWKTLLTLRSWVAGLVDYVKNKNNKQLVVNQHDLISFLLMYHGWGGGVVKEGGGERETGLMTI